MTEPDKAPAHGAAPRTGDQQMARPSVSTAPARPGRFSAIPSHLGRARTSTVVLGLLFIGIFALYLTIKPADPVATSTTTTTETGTEQPAPTPAPTTTAPDTPAEPTTPDPETTTAPTPEPEPTPDEETTGTTVPEETAEVPLPTDPAPTTRAGTPTAVTPTG